MIATACIAAATAQIRLVGISTTRYVAVVFPSDWPQETLLAYVTDHHPNEKVEILSFGSSLLWIANPAAFTDYRQGVRA